MFDEIAETYDATIPQLPPPYLDLIRQTFSLRESDRILDLGCGSGLLTFPLAEISKNVEGLDSSTELLRLGRDRDVNRCIEWVHSRVEDFTFLSNRYKLILAFESFHLFPQKAELIHRISRALIDGGYFGVGWCEYHWECILREIIIETFDEYGITWGEWGYQSVPELESIIGCCQLGPLIRENVCVPDQSSDLQDIAAYLVSIGKASRLSSDARRKLQEQLVSRFYCFTKAEVIGGTSVYSVSYARHKQRAGKQR